MVHIEAKQFHAVNLISRYQVIDLNQIRKGLKTLG